MFRNVLKFVFHPIAETIKWHDERVKKIHPHPRAQKVFHTGHGLLHLIYFAGVAVEGHGIYAMAGGGLFIMGVVGAIAHFGGEE